MFTCHGEDGGTVLEWDPIANIEYSRLDFHRVCGAHTRISSICATSRLLLAGGFFGELAVKRIDGFSDAGGEDSPPIQVTRLTHDENGITNHIFPIHDHSSMSNDPYYGHVYGRSVFNLIQ